MFGFLGGFFRGERPGIRAALDSTGIDHARDARMNAKLLRHLLDDRFLFLPPFLALAGSLPQEPKQEAEGSRDRPKGSDGGRFKRHGLRRVELGRQSQASVCGIFIEAEKLV